MPVKKTKRRVAKKPAKRSVKKHGAKKTVRGRTTKTVKPKKRGRKPGRKAKKVTKKVVKKKSKKRAKRGRKKAAPKKAAEKAEVARGGRKIKKTSRRSVKVSAGAKKKITDFLTSHGVKFDVIKHSPAFTAQQVAASAHVPGKELAKTVIVKIDDRLVMVVEPAHLKVNLDALRRQLGAQSVELATESEFRNQFPECELGAMPPFGNLYDMDVFISHNIDQNDHISFNAGTHAELIQMSYEDFFELVQPKVIYD